MKRNIFPAFAAILFFSLSCLTSGAQEVRQYPIMQPQWETLRRWQRACRATAQAPFRRLDVRRGSLSLLSHLNYTPAERDQGSCGSCWQWASTGIMGVALDVQTGIRDRLSIQFMASCGNWSDGVCGCRGGQLSMTADYYRNKGFAVPWSNANAEYQNGAGSCGETCDSIATTPNYPISSINPQTIQACGVGQAQAVANIKNVLNQNKAVWFAFYLPNEADWNTFFEFWNCQGTWAGTGESGVFSYDYSCGHTWVNGQGGGHAVLCVGYDDSDPDNAYWIMLNSWGTVGGNRPNGLFRVNMDMNYDCTVTYGYEQVESFQWMTLDMSYDVQGQRTPVVTTETATAVSTATATLNGSVNPCGASTDWYFEYGADTAYGSSTESADAGAGQTAFRVQADVDDLDPETMYHYRIVAQNSAGTSYGADRTFTTAGETPQPPTVTTEAAGSVGAASATLNGTVNPRGQNTSCCFEYGPTTSYGSVTPTVSGQTGSGVLSVNRTITGLNAETTYHYRIKAWNAAGTSYGGDRVFTTAAQSDTLLSEGFEGGALPEGWEQWYEWGSVDWTFQAGGAGGQYPSDAYEGGYNAFFYDPSYTVPGTDLVTPVIDFGHHTNNAVLTFEHFMSEDPWYGDQDELYVYGSADGGNSWTLLASYYNSVPQWTERTVSIPNPGSQYRIAFQGIGYWGYGIALDNIRVIGQASAPVALSLTTEVAPAGSGSVSPSGTVSVTAGQPQIITATAAAHCHFVNWIVSGSAVIADPGAPNTTVTLNGNATVTANFAPDTAALTLDAHPDAGGTTAPSKGEHTVVEGAAIAISAMAANDYTFVNWTASDNATLTDPNAPTTTVVLTGDASVSANFNQNTPGTATMTMQSLPSGSGNTTPSQGAHTVTAGVPQSITATPTADVHFVNWSVEGGAVIADTTAASTTATLSDNAVLTAHFAPDTAQLTLAAEPDGTGSTSPALGTHSVNVGQPVQVTAHPAANCRFAGWRVGGSGSVADTNAVSTTVTLSGNASLTARFASEIPAQATLTMAADPTAGGSIMPTAGGHLVNTGEAQPISATPGPGYDFASWTLTGNAEVADPGAADTAVTLSGNATVTAHFAAQGISGVLLTMAVSPALSGSTTPAQGAHTVATNVPLALSATPADGYYFEGWSVSGDAAVAHSNGTPTTVTLFGNSVITANFALESTPQVKMVMAVTPAGTGRTTPAAGTHMVDVNVPQAIAAVATNVEYAFSRWVVSGGGVVADSTAPTTSVTMVGDATVKAEFRRIGGQTSTLSISVNPALGGYTYPEEGDYTASNGVDYVVMAMPFYGYHFVEWTGSEFVDITDPYADTTIISVSGNATLTAGFAPDSTESYVENDFDGDGRADIVDYWADGCTWYYRYSSRPSTAYDFGWYGSFAAPGDFDGDGIADTVIYTAGEWDITFSSDDSWWYFDWGWGDAVPVSGDFDGDGYWDLAVYWPVTGNWYIQQSSDGQTRVTSWGWWDALPVPADYDGDGMTDLAVYHAPVGNWYVLKSSNGQMLYGGAFNWGWYDALPAPADYDGDDRADIGVYWPAGGQWYIYTSSGLTINYAWGWADSVPVPADYDGDGRADIGVYYSVTGNWYIRQSSDGSIYGGGPINWGWPAANPVLRQYQILRWYGRVP